MIRCYWVLSDLLATRRVFVWFVEGWTSVEPPGGYQTSGWNITSIGTIDTATVECLGIINGLSIGCQLLVAVQWAVLGRYFGRGGSPGGVTGVDRYNLCWIGSDRIGSDRGILNKGRFTTSGGCVMAGRTGWVCALRNKRTVREIRTRCEFDCPGCMFFPLLARLLS